MTEELKSEEIKSPFNVGDKIKLINKKSELKGYVQLPLEIGKPLFLYDKKIKGNISGYISKVVFFDNTTLKSMFNIYEIKIESE